MVNPQYQNDLIIKTYYEKEINTLCLLKGKRGGSIYIEFFNLYESSTDILTLNDVYIKPDRFYYDPEIEPIYQFIEESAEIKVQIIVSLHAFEICFKSNLILLEASFTEFPIVEQFPRDKEGDYYILFNLNGELLFHKKIDKRNTWTPANENNIVRFFEYGCLAYISSPNDYEGKFKRWRISTGEYVETELLRDKELVDNHYLYEYLDDFDINKEKNLLALLFSGPTNGEFCVRVLESIAFDKLTTIFSFIDSGKNGTLQFVSINPLGEKLALLAYADWNIENIPNVDILIYNFNGTKPENRIKTEINYSEISIINIQHYSPDVLCIITLNDIFLYDLISGKEIRRLVRDEESPYFVSSEIIFYSSDSNLVVFTIDNDKLSSE